MESVTRVCRICLNVSPDYISLETPFECDEGQTMSEDITNEINYLQCLRLCTNLPIEENDDGPQSLCEECGADLQVVYKFLKKAQNSQKIFEENWLQNSSKETIEHTEISIEKFDDLEIEHLDKEEYVSEYNELSIASTEFSNDFDESSKDFFEEAETIEYNDAGKMEEVITNECESNESLHEVEDLSEANKTSQNTYIFIPKKHKCHICNRSYTTERLLKVHLSYHKRRNVGSKPYSCKICGGSFPLQRYLTQHMIEHQDCREIHKCQYCDKEYISKTALTSHKRIHQGETLHCDECGKQFNGTYEFTIHQRFHRREKAMAVNKCDICYKQYSSPRNLSQHMAVHFGDREVHKCNYCHKEYVSKSALNNHKRLHEGQTTECNVCGKAFTRNCELNIHMRFHKGEHPFKCTMCEKEFTIKGHLKTHMWEHQGIKLECDECGKLFKSTKALNEHSYTHGEMPYPCKFCDKAYPSKQKYKLHLERAHCDEINEIDLSQIESLTNTKTLKMRKNITYVQIMKEEETNGSQQIN